MNNWYLFFTLFTHLYFIIHPTYFLTKKNLVTDINLPTLFAYFCSDFYHFLWKNFHFIHSLCSRKLLFSLIKISFSVISTSANVLRPFLIKIISTSSEILRKSFLKKEQKKNIFTKKIYYQLEYSWPYSTGSSQVSTDTKFDEIWFSVYLYSSQTSP